MNNTEKLMIETMAAPMRAQREEMEKRNAFAIGEDIPEIGLLAVVALDTTEAIRKVHGDDAANLYIGLAHPRNAVEMRRDKKSLIESMQIRSRLGN